MSTKHIIMRYTDLCRQIGNIYKVEFYTRQHKIACSIKLAKNGVKVQDDGNMFLTVIDTPTTKKISIKK